jgi:hypothetical protein
MESPWLQPVLKLGLCSASPYTAPYSSKAGGYGLDPTLTFLGVQKLNGSGRKKKTQGQNLY